MKGAELGMNDLQTITITGGAGYVGSALVPELLRRGYTVKVIDLFVYGMHVFDDIASHPNLYLVCGDIRDADLLKREIAGSDALIHLACISNDPSFELNPALGKSINYDAFFPILAALEESDTQRFIYASSSSVYGVRHEPEITEEAPKTPLTDYSRYKLECEQVLRQWEKPDHLDWTIIRPATVCGYSPRLRLDLTVNILTIHALINHKIKVFGGKQLRPNIHIKDMVRVYSEVLETDKEKAAGKIFNAGYQNESVENIAKKVKTVLDDPSIEIEYLLTDDNRSYHVNSDKIREDLGFRTCYTIEDAIEDIHRVYTQGQILDGLNNEYYYNIQRMKNIDLTNIRRGPETTGRLTYA